MCVCVFTQPQKSFQESVKKVGQGLEQDARLIKKSEVGGGERQKKDKREIVRVCERWKSNKEEC